MVNNCSDVFHLYRTEHVTLYGQYCVKMFSCVLAATTQYTQANFGSAGVLLGLTPTVLATAGSTTPELALLASRRPILAIAIVIGSPAVNALRAFDFSKSITDFKRIEFDAEPPKLDSKFKEKEEYRFSNSGKRPILIVGLQWLFALGALGNLAEISYRININTICIMSCDNSDMLVELWIGLAMVTHMLGTATFFSRSQRLYTHKTTVGYWLGNEFKPCKFHEDAQLEWDEENMWFMIFSWLTSVFTLCHLAFWNFDVFVLVLCWYACPSLSNLLKPLSANLTGTPWATYIVGRFLLSALVCRTIVAYELSGIKIAHERWHSSNRDRERRQVFDFPPLSKPSFYF